MPALPFNFGHLNFIFTLLTGFKYQELFENIQYLKEFVIKIDKRKDNLRRYVHSGKESGSFQVGYNLVSCRIGVHFELVSAVTTMPEKVKDYLLPLYKRSTKINKRDFLLLLWFVLKTNLKDCLKY